MAQLNLLERATEAVVMLNGNRRQVLDMWLNGKKVWPIDEPVVELAVDKTLVILNKDNNYHDTITVFASDTAEWEFGNQFVITVNQPKKKQMATIPSYLSWVPKTGTGNAQIKINSVSPYTGRADRSTKVPGKIVGKSNAVTVTVLEKAADEFITPDGLTINVAKGGGTIHVTGKSNSKLLTFTWKTNFGIANVTSFKVNGSTTATSGTAITGDPGATGEYTYDVTVVVPKNETIKARSATLEIKGEGSTVVETITITQALGDSYLYLNSQGTTTATVIIPKGGGERTLRVLSNDEWTFEPAE